MSTPSTAPETPPQAVTDPPAAAEDGTPATPPDPDLAAARAEAAQRRRQLRTVEAERDALRGRVDEYDRREVDRLAAAKFKNPDDLWLATSLDAMRAEDGTIDMTKADAEIGRVLSEREHWAKPVVGLQPDPHMGPRPDPPGSNGPSFGSAIKGRLGGR